MSLACPRRTRQRFLTANVRDLIAATTAATRARAIALIRGSQGAVSYGDTGLDETVTAMREEMHRFSEAEVVPHAQEWHLKDEYVPMELIGQMAELGVFALTLPEEYGGLGLGKEAMCVVSEELVARLYRRRLARHALGDRRGADPERRHRRPEAGMAAEDRERRGAAHGGVHRAEHRLRPRLAHHARGEGRRRLSHHRAEDLDHPCGPRRSHDRARPHQSEPRRAIAGSRCSWHQSRAAPTTIPFRPKA